MRTHTYMHVCVVCVYYVVHQRAILSFFECPNKTSLSWQIALSLRQ